MDYTALRLIEKVASICLGESLPLCHDRHERVFAGLHVLDVRPLRCERLGRSEPLR